MPQSNFIERLCILIWRLAGSIMCHQYPDVCQPDLGGVLGMESVFSAVNASLFEA